MPGAQITNEDTALTFSIAPLWATEKLHDYFYQVDSQFVTDQRAEFDASSGYLGSEISLGVSFNATDTVRIFMFAQLGLYSSAENRQSPLFIDDTTYSAGIGVSWRLFESEQTVTRN